MIEDLNEDHSTDKYLIYQLAADLFATPLLEIRGVIEYQAAKPIPHTAAFYEGVINLRGEIVGVIDLRVRLNIGGAGTPNCQLVFDTDVGPLAATVDRVLSVSALTEADIDRRTAVTGSNRDRPYFLGVGRHGERLVTLISLHKLVEMSQLTSAS
ncbi:MAG: chemotaxis protein CheW [Bdellovibrionales bacterium]